MASSPGCVPGRDPQEGPASSADALDRPLGHRPLLSVFGGTVSLWSCRLHGAAGPRGWMQEHGVQGWVCRWHPRGRQACRSTLASCPGLCCLLGAPHAHPAANLTALHLWELLPPSALLLCSTVPPACSPLWIVSVTHRGGCTGICFFLTHPIAITYLPVSCLLPPLALPRVAVNLKASWRWVFPRGEEPVHSVALDSRFLGLHGLPWCR